FDVDVNGNLWRLESGYIYKFDNVDEWEKAYKVDGSMSEMDVYDANNIVVWDEEDEVYSIVGNKEVEEDKTEEDDKVEVVAGWVKNSDGTWSYNKADGTKATGWLNLNGTWYYLNNNGIMQTGWLNLSGTWYYLQSSGAMATGWANVNGTWYYMQSSGAMKTGWLNDNGTWYYLNSNGSMAVNTTVGGYKLGSNGAWIR
ncbi:MAG: N-acetylmuramoyl-L-alanine amidase family protein, partial [Clostridium sp.]|nr:N-acetylmuramoyl-L-alanine amidase family protein [Clostridium sp.]